LRIALACVHYLPETAESCFDKIAIESAIPKT
jgi:hypothetical protein